MSQLNRPKQIIVDKNPAGTEPFTDWLTSLQDPTTRRRILKRLRYLKQRHCGDIKSVGNGIYKLRFFFGAGYRGYFAEDGDTLIILLCGGDKSNQIRDIDQAQTY